MASKHFVTRLYINAENVTKTISQKRKEIRMTTFAFDKCTLTFCATETKEEENLLNGELNLMYSDSFLAMDIVTGNGIKKNLEYSGKVQINKKSISCGFEDKRDNAVTCGLVNVRLENRLLYGYVITVTKERTSEDEDASAASVSAADTDFEIDGFLFGNDHAGGVSRDPHVDTNYIEVSDIAPCVPSNVSCAQGEVEFVHVSDDDDGHKPQTDLQKRLLENESSIKDLLNHFESFSKVENKEDCVDKCSTGSKLMLDEPREKEISERDKDAPSVVYRPPQDCTIDLYYKNVFDSPTPEAEKNEKNNKHKEHRKTKEREKKHHDKEKEKKSRTHTGSQKRKSTRSGCTKSKRSRESEPDQKTDEVKIATNALLDSQLID